MTAERTSTADLLQRVAEAIEKEAKATEPDWARTLKLCREALYLERLVARGLEAYELSVAHTEAMLKEKA